MSINLYKLPRSADSKGLKTNMFSHLGDLLTESRNSLVSFHVLEQICIRNCHSAGGPKLCTLFGFHIY